MAVRRAPARTVMDRYAPFDPGGRSPRPRPRVGMDCIRQARAEDIETIAALSLARDGGERHDVTRRIGLEIAGLSDDVPWNVFVAEIDGEVAGYGRVRFLEPAEPDVPPGWYLTGVIVDPAHRRRGVGLALTRARIAWVRERADTLYYFVNRENRASIDLHERLGFELVGPVAHARAKLDREDGRLYGLSLGETSDA